ncbi:carbohydrate kinase family protein [Sulfoacidibacillus thermotolerans]|uniref:Carbohydrate kinase PfkB domain-containing protein n=1 Tax=Sulfoacidibacillus thermotolerans TaxID=1765684 RepID=A0A2U3D9A4_SULT2|nr:carbohydrate kinase [Sulfoacidibacillus thermotolerans]PWI57870.1 hypothetical protein BM613_06740 [Sulfoacidibacillus thermotolerans]
MKRVITVGEALIDLIAMEETEKIAQAQTFSRQAGGAPANVAVAIARLGGLVEFVGSLGCDPFGDYLMQTLRGYGVSVKYVARVEQATTLAFVARADGESQYYFVRNPGADTLLTVSQVEQVPIDKDSILYFGSNSLAQNPLREALVSLLQNARANQALISFDVNFRQAFWVQGNDPKDACQKVLPLVDLVKVNRQELFWLTSERDEVNAAIQIAQMTDAVILCTRGSHGVLIFHRKWERPLVVPSYVAPVVVDTTGAGDSFMGAFLYQCAKWEVQREELVLLSEERWSQWGHFAAAAAALTVGKLGAMAAMPSRNEVEQVCVTSLDS